MKTKRTLLCLAALALSMSGCIPSFHPLYTDDTLIFEEKLIGKWIGDDDGIWEFKKAGDKKYELRIFDGKEGRFEVHLVELDGMMFLDIYPGENKMFENTLDFYTIHILPAHTFMKVDQVGPNLELRWVNLGELIEDNPDLLNHEVVDNGAIITASTEELQEIIIEYVDSVIDDDVMEFTPLEPLYSEEELVFAKELTGIWMTSDGDILKLEETEDQNYKMILTEEDGQRFVFAANLVQHNNKLFFGMFCDESALSNEDYYRTQLLPDTFLRVNQIEPQLLLQKISYSEFNDMINAGVNSEDQQTTDADYVFNRISN